MHVGVCVCMCKGARERTHTKKEKERQRMKGRGEERKKICIVRLMHMDLFSISIHSLLWDLVHSTNMHTQLTMGPADTYYTHVN